MALRIFGKSSRREAQTEFGKPTGLPDVTGRILSLKEEDRTSDHVSGKGWAGKKERKT